MDTMMHNNSKALAEGFKEIVKAARDGRTPEALKVTFRKRDNSIRAMVVAFDPNMLGTIKGIPFKGAEKRAETNEIRSNLTVRERLDDGTFQWRTIPCARVMSISPVL